MEIVKLLGRWDAKFGQQLKDSPRNATYLSNRSQNDMLLCMKSEVFGCIRKTALSSQLYSVMMDETADLSGQEQVSVVIRFVDDNEEIQERLISVAVAQSTTAASLTELLKSTIENFGLSLAQLRGQCYDGASTMSGRFNGVQARIKREQPLAIYVHCYAHCLNLAIVAATKQNRIACNAFGIMEKLYAFVKSSPARMQMFSQVQKEQDDEDTRLGTTAGSSSDGAATLRLKQLSDTRWACRSESLKVVQSKYSCIVKT
eukprot:m.264587 g.264587  ORF g.264587 m.264587 type:complete len:259 (+) comp40472_c3_seq1:545-1321(+)